MIRARSGANLDAQGAAWYSCAVPAGSSDDPIPEQEIASGRLLAAVAYLPGLCFIGLLGAPENRFVGFHARQGLLLLLVEIAAWIAVASRREAAVLMAPTGEKRFWLLRRLSRAFSIAAWIVLVLVVLVTPGRGTTRSSSSG